MRTKPWVLVDISYLAHRARYAMDGLEHGDMPTGVIYGFFEQLRTLCQDENINSNKVVFLFDSRKSHRKVVFPDYKKKRADDLTEEERQQIEVMRDQVELLRSVILPRVGFQVHRQTGCESDDLMAVAAQYLTESVQKGIMVTADGDLWQCISDTVHWYDPARRNYYDPKNFKRKKKIESHRWGLVKAIAGCSTDGVPGIPGVGEDSAIKYILGKLPEHYKRFKAIVSPEGREIIKRNIELVVLPHKKTKPFVLQEPKFNVKSFFRFCKRYGILSYLKEEKRAEWERFFSKNEVRSRRRVKRGRND